MRHGKSSAASAPHPRHRKVVADGGLWARAETMKVMTPLRSTTPVVEVYHRRLNAFTGGTSHGHAASSSSTMCHLRTGRARCHRERVGADGGGQRQGHR